MSNITSKGYPVQTSSQGNDQFAIVRNGQLMKLTRSGLEAYIKQLAPGTLLSLSDTPSSYVGQQGRVLVVNPSEDGMVFEAATSGNFLALSDTPASYGGQAGKLAVVDGDEEGLEFIDNFFIRLGDTPASYSGQSLKAVRVNQAASAVEFVDPAVYQVTGWAEYSDTEYTEGSPFAVSAGTTVDLPNNSGTVIDEHLPTGVSSLYDGTVIKPDTVGDSYEISIRFKTKSSVNEGAVRLAIDIGGAMDEITADGRRLNKGSGDENTLQINFSVYSLATFIANGGTIKFEAVAGDQSVYDIRYIITRTHKGIA